MPCCDSLELSLYLLLQMHRAQDAPRFRGRWLLPVPSAPAPPAQPGGQVQCRKTEELV